MTYYPCLYHIHSLKKRLTIPFIEYKQGNQPDYLLKNKI